MTADKTRIREKAVALLAGHRGRLIVAATAGIIYLGMNIHWLVNSSRWHVATRPVAWYEHFRIFTVLVQRFYFGELHYSYLVRHSWLHNLLFAAPDGPPAFYGGALAVKIACGWFAPEAVLLSSTLAMLIVLRYVYLLTESVQEHSGLPAVWLSLLVPLVWLPARTFDPTAQLAAVGLAFLHHMSAYDREPRLRGAAAVGIWAGVGMLTDHAGIVLALILLARVLKAAVGRHAPAAHLPRRDMTHWVFAVTIACGIAWLYYGDPTGRAHFIFFLKEWVQSIGNIGSVGSESVLAGVSLGRAIGLLGAAGVVALVISFAGKKIPRAIGAVPVILWGFMLATLPQGTARTAVLLLLVLTGISSLAALLHIVCRRGFPYAASALLIGVGALVLIHQGTLFRKPFAYGSTGFRQTIKQIAAAPAQVGYVSDARSRYCLITLEQCFVLWGRHPVLVRDIPGSPKEFYYLFHYFDALIIFQSEPPDTTAPGDFALWILEQARDQKERDYVASIVARIDRARNQFTLAGSYRVRPELLFETPLRTAYVWRRIHLTP